MIGSSNDETNFPHKLLLTHTQVSKIRKAFANGSSANIKLSKTHLSKMIQSGVFVGNFVDTFFSPDKMTKKLLMEHINYLKKRSLII